MRKLSKQRKNVYRRKLRAKKKFSQAEIVNIYPESPIDLPLDSDELVQKKAKERGDQTFTLVGRDPTSPKTIGFWILENIETAPEEKLSGALRIALEMRKNFGRKQAD